eukprot:g32532.t1
MLLGYLGFVAKSNDSTKSEDQSLLSAWPEAVPWMLLSMTLSIFNKWIFLPAGGNFPFPMTVSYVPLGGSLLAISVVLSNSAAVLLSVAFVNMLKGGNPVVALLLGLTLGTSSCNWRMLCPVLVIMFGAVATVRGELSLSYLGLALLVTAIVVEQFRLVLFKSMKSESGLSLDPLSALSLFAPVAFAFTAVAAACERQTPMAIDRVQGCALALNALVAVTLNIAYSRLLKVASPVTFTVFGTAKDGIGLVLHSEFSELWHLPKHRRMEVEQYPRDRLLSLRRYDPTLICIWGLFSQLVGRARSKKSAKPEIQEPAPAQAAKGAVEAPLSYGQVETGLSGLPGYPRGLLPEWEAPPTGAPPGFAFDAPPSRLGSERVALP